jgi:hypothetical protein
MEGQGSSALEAYKEGVRDARRTQREDRTIKALLVVVSFVAALMLLSWYQAHLDRERLWQRLESYEVWIATTREIMIKLGMEGVPNVSGSMHEDPPERSDGESDGGAEESQ